MDNEEPRRTPFDQRAALEELQRLRLDIARYRAQREAFGEEFERNVSSGTAVGRSVASSPSTMTRIQTRRTVVIADSEDGGTRVPLNVEKTIVIRTGDAGDVRLAIRGEERGFLGVEGEMVTRSFAVPPRRAPAGR